MKAISFDSKYFKVDPLPTLSPCYCDECKKPLTASRVLDKGHAWCPDCKSVVATSWFQVPAWVIGATLFVFVAQRFLF